MGSISKLFKSIAFLPKTATKAAINAGKSAADFVGDGKKTTNLAQEKATSDLQKEAKETSKQRQALFATEGGILGEEVEGVGRKKRGTILGN